MLQREFAAAMARGADRSISKPTTFRRQCVSSFPAETDTLTFAPSANPENRFGVCSEVADQFGPHLAPERVRETPRRGPVLHDVRTSATLEYSRVRWNNGTGAYTDEEGETAMGRLAGKNVIVTGASTGIGRAIAIRFAEEGANVIINYLADPENAEETLASILKQANPSGAGQKHVIVQADVSKEDQVRKLFADSISALGGLDVVVNNAGIQKASPTEQIDMRDFDQVLNVNLRGTFMCSREAVRHFLERGKRGVILNNSSVHEIIPKPKYLPYSVSKGGMENLTKTMALEYADRGIRVNAVGPGAVVTPINNAWINDPKARTEVERHIPMGRAADPAEIASVFAFLASDDASYITGQTIFACGGLTLYPEFRVAWSSGE